MDLLDLGFDQVGWLVVCDAAPSITGHFCFYYRHLVRATNRTTVVARLKQAGIAWKTSYCLEGDSGIAR